MSLGSLATKLVRLIKLDKLSEDARGWHFSLSTRFSDIHLASLAPGMVRGNHFHESCTEFLCVFGGLIRVKLANHDGSIVEDFNVDCLLRPFIIEIPPKIIHAIKNIGNTTVYLVCGYIGNLEPNTNKVKILE